MTLAFLPVGTLGIGEIVILVLVIVLLFGSRKLPALARALGSSLAEFRKGRREGTEQDKKSESETNESLKGKETSHGKT